MITITIDTDNEAFGDLDMINGVPAQQARDELRRILKSMVIHDGQPLMDINGNTVGKVTIT